MPDIPLYPLAFTPIYKHKVWGGNAMAQHLGRSLPGDDIGESWELVDLAATRASGGGGAAERSVVAYGPLAGQPINQLIAMYGRQLMGDAPLSPEGGFPLLLKYLDARANLSVQVHPSPAYAKQHPDAHLKSEAWYIVHAEPGAVIYKGVDEGVTPSLFKTALLENSEEAVRPFLLEMQVEAGECHYLPSGTLHALGAGILVAEVQTPSDTTFRVFDWGREGRALHIEQAMQCITWRPPDTERYEPHTQQAGQGYTGRTLVACEHFRIDELTTEQGCTLTPDLGKLQILMLVDATGYANGRGVDDQPLAKGTTVLLPPDARGASVTLEAGAKWLSVLPR